MSNILGNYKSLLSLALLAATSASAQSAASVAIPSEINTARSIFVANAGGPNNAIAIEAYTAFYAGLVSDQKFQIVSKPSEAELALELTTTSHVNSDYTNSPSLYLQLAIRDVKTQQLLWSLSEPINAVFLTSVSQKALSFAVSDLLIDLGKLRSGNINDLAAASRTKKKH